MVQRVTIDPLVGGAERIHLLFAARGTSATAWARSEGLHRSQVSMAITGARPYPKIRARLALYFGKPRTVIDALIEGRGDAEG
jgi:hypothetical protein